MMQKLRNPKNVKLISLFVAAIFVLGCFALSVTQSGVGKSAFAASSESAIGVDTYQMLVVRSPDLNGVNTAMSKEIFAVGAVKAAKFLAGKPAGFYTMKEVLE